MGVPWWQAQHCLDFLIELQGTAPELQFHGVAIVCLPLGFCELCDCTALDSLGG